MSRNEKGLLIFAKWLNGSSVLTETESVRTFRMSRYVTQAIGTQQELTDTEAIFAGITEERVKPYDKALTVPMPPPHQESEYAIPIDRAAEAIRVVRRLIEDNHFHDFILVEVRFVAADNIMLSPAYDRQVCYVGGYIFDDPHATNFFLHFEAAMKKLQGRPHWGKHITLSADEARHMYPRFDRFNEIRRDFDPRGVFANTFIRNLFG